MELEILQLVSRRMMFDFAAMMAAAMSLMAVIWSWTSLAGRHH